ncbi:MAG TPA: tRNA-intron lyase [archaeon]|nr:tRNA-intron lyase [archaeon]
MALLAGQKIVVSEKRLIDQLRQKGFGEPKQKQLILDLREALFLLEKQKLELQDADGKEVSEEALLKFASKKEKNFFSKFLVFRDLREKGYCVKTGFKFGFDLRVYPRGKKPGEEHTQWVIKVAEQSERFSMPEYSRMVRIAQNLHTMLLIAIVDAEGDINFYEAKRVLP